MRWLLFSLLMIVVHTGSLLAVELGEVTGLHWDVDAVTLRWDTEPSAQSYNVYRGYIRNLATDYFGTFLEGERTSTSHPDPVTPAADWGFFYLVTAQNPGQERTMGLGRAADGTATERPNVHPWPGLEVAGRWEGLRDWPTVAIHSVLLHTGQLITWGKGDPSETVIWDPASDTFQFREADADMFCAGHAVLPDGRLLSVGGTLYCCPFVGGIWSGLFDPIDLSWSPGPTMLSGRWYPTTVAMGDGRSFAFGGRDVDTVNPFVEIFTAEPGGPGDWEILKGATRYQELYPRMHLLPSGKLVETGPSDNSHLLDPETGTWSYLAKSQYGFRREGASVMLPPGHERFLILGGWNAEAGESLATATAEIIDLADPSTPAWSYASPMHFRRMHANAVILPDARVLVAGGGHDDHASAYSAEIFDPLPGNWTVVAALHSMRLYHSTAILLPDGRVFWAGADDNPTAEFYSPGYLFRGPRPTIASAPEALAYGEVFDVDTPDAASIASVTLIRPGSVTHSFDMEQRYVGLEFAPGTESLSVVAPTNPNVAPPGYYMLFLVDGDGVPSVASFVRLF